MIRIISFCLTASSILCGPTVNAQIFHVDTNLLIQTCNLEGTRSAAYCEGFLVAVANRAVTDGEICLNPDTTPADLRALFARGANALSTSEDPNNAEVLAKKIFAATFPC